MSIDSQIKDMQTLAQRDGAIIKEIRYESHSAKQSEQRTVFKELIHRTSEVGVLLDPVISILFYQFLLAKWDTIKKGYSILNNDVV